MPKYIQHKVLYLYGITPVVIKARYRDQLMEDEIVTSFGVGTELPG